MSILYVYIYHFAAIASSHLFMKYSFIHMYIYIHSSIHTCIDINIPFLPLRSHGILPLLLLLRHERLPFLPLSVKPRLHFPLQVPPLALVASVFVLVCLVKQVI